MVKRPNPARQPSRQSARPKRKSCPAAGPTSPHAGKDHQSAAIDALFDDFARNLARKLINKQTNTATKNGGEH